MKCLVGGSFPDWEAQELGLKIQLAICPHCPTIQDRQKTSLIINRRRLEWAVSTLKPFKVPGADHIILALLQQGVGVLIKLYRLYLLLGYTMVAWRTANMVFIGVLAATPLHDG